MAMVTTSTLLPDTRDFSLLANLRGSLTVSRQASGRPTSELLRVEAADASSVLLTIAWTDVVFKFEIFGVKIQPVSLAQQWQWEPIAAFRGTQTISCLFRFEWQRTARPGEVPPDWEQIVAARGPRSAVPDAATEIGASMVGLVFGDELDVTRLLVMTESDVPGTFQILVGAEEIQRATADCEKVDLRDADRFSKGIAEWMRSFLSK
jgi:hypothetical protein